jgi:2',3'-cyclic-nucleotide 2'-phosphodiesterase
MYLLSWRGCGLKGILKMRILFIGDVVGIAGIGALSSFLPPLLSRWNVDVTIVNGENSAESGFGITRDTYRAIREAGADVVTLGNHSWNRKEALELANEEVRLIRPINYVPGTPGSGLVDIKTQKGKRALVINALGRLFMEPADDPFGAVSRTLEKYRLAQDVDAIVLDFHCEATGEKQAMGHFCDGRVSLVAGTHTHTPSADYRILSGGTAYITDVGMTGDYDSVVGMDRSEPVKRFATGISSGRFVAAGGAATMCGVAVETDDSTGLALRTAAVRRGPHLEVQQPTFWD